MVKWVALVVGGSSIGALARLAFAEVRWDFYSARLRWYAVLSNP